MPWLRRTPSRRRNGRASSPRRCSPGSAAVTAIPASIGAVKESVAVAGAVRAAKADADPLVAEVAAAYETAEGRD
ncbi:MAG TPA: hypothetical protein VM891_12615, partial [Amaricoccus sp.]|nr:hypothetical protein [Amaricoccus sp.]